MTLSDLADFGEIVGAFGVIISLVYLALQVRQANAIARTDAYRDMHQDINSILTTITTNPELHKIWRAGLYSHETLTVEDSERLGLTLFQLFGALNGGFQSSWVDPSISDYVRTMTDLQLQYPYVREWWSRQGRLHPQPFRMYVDQRIEAIEKEMKVGNDNSA
jgi:hypothetical protein